MPSCNQGWILEIGSTPRWKHCGCRRYSTPPNFKVAQMFVSSPAPTCPHCGRPSKRSRLPIEIAAGLGLGVLCIVALAWQSGWGDEAARRSAAPVDNPETAIARPDRQLTQSLDAFIGYNRTLYLFRVENRDAFPWTHCQVTLNSHGIAGYDLDVESIKPGLTDAPLLHSAEFVDAEGKSFDPTTNQVTTVALDCETPEGHRYYRGKFGPRDSVGR